MSLTMKVQDHAIEFNGVRRSAGKTSRKAFTSRRFHSICMVPILKIGNKVAQKYTSTELSYSRYSRNVIASGNESNFSSNLITPF